MKSSNFNEWGIGIFVFTHLRRGLLLIYIQGFARTSSMNKSAVPRFLYLTIPYRGWVHYKPLYVMPVIFGILGVLGYVLITYIVKSIILSFYEPDELTIQVLSNIDTYTAPTIAFCVCTVFFFSWKGKLIDKYFGWYVGLIFFGGILFANLPYSIGMVMLCNLIWAGCVFASAFRFRHFKKPLE